MTSGYVFLYRQLLEKPIWTNSTAEQCKILITLLLMANHRESEWEWRGTKYKVAPGQFITSLDSIVSKCGDKSITTKKVRTALDRFKKLEFLACETANTGRLITILNWHLYQVDACAQGKPNGKHRANDGQAEGKHRATNKNDKKDKTYKSNTKPPIIPLEAKSKVQFAEFVSLTNAEYSALVAEHGEHGARRMIEILDNYKGSSGKRYRSDYRAILNWVVVRYTEENSNVVKLSRREQDDIERRRLAEEYDRFNGQQANRQVQSKLPAALQY